jgi:hypothetical protein
MVGGLLRAMEHYGRTLVAFGGGVDSSVVPGRRGAVTWAAAGGRCHRGFSLTARRGTFCRGRLLRSASLLLTWPRHSATTPGPQERMPLPPAADRLRAL